MVSTMILTITRYKSALMIVRSSMNKQIRVPTFNLNNTQLNECEEVASKKVFYICSIEVKIQLFRSYCTPLYTAQLWCYYNTASMHKLTVAYNDALRMLLGIPRFARAGETFAVCGLPTCGATIRRLV